ncbi:MAG: UDP-glucose 4-epimerase GalE [Bradymonadales bacterium]|nr:UDP-glucose 4-epimerase GalE [Bradymonadales bacterium]
MTMTCAEGRYILVAGGAGYIGSHAVIALLERGYQVLVVDDLSTGRRELLQPGCSLEEGDLGDPEFIRGVFARYPVAAVMHFAAFSIVPESVSDPVKYYRNNVAKTVTLLDAMLDAGCKVFILSSTAAVYGEPERTPIEEGMPTRPTNPYGRSKLMIEQILADVAAARPLHYTSLRYFNAAGADPGLRAGELHEPETHLIPIILQVAAEIRPSVTVFGTDYPTHDGSCIRDYIHVTDLAEAHLLALDHLLGGGSSGVYNLGNGTGFSVLEVIETARRVTGRKVHLVEGPRRPGDPAVLVASSARIARDLGWRPRHQELEQIIDTAWRWTLSR